MLTGMVPRGHKADDWRTGGRCRVAVVLCFRSDSRVIVESLSQQPSSRAQQSAEICDFFYLHLAVSAVGDAGSLTLQKLLYYVSQ